MINSTDDYSKKPAQDCLNLILGYGNIGKSIFQQYGENPTSIVSKSYNSETENTIKSFKDIDFENIEESTILIHLCTHHKYLKQTLRDNFDEPEVDRLHNTNKKIVIFNYTLTSSDLIYNFLINKLNVSEDLLEIHEVQLTHKLKIIPRLATIAFINYYLSFYKGTYFTSDGMLEHAYGKLKDQPLTPENVSKLYTACFHYYSKAYNSLR